MPPSPLGLRVTAVARPRRQRKHQLFKLHVIAGILWHGHYAVKLFAGPYILRYALSPVWIMLFAVRALAGQPNPALKDSPFYNCHRRALTERKDRDLFLCVE